MLRGQKAPVSQAKPVVRHTVETAIHNRFDVVVSRNGEEIQKAVGYNIILNSLWSQLLTAQNFMWFRYIGYGSGTGELNPTRTDLFTRIGSKDAGSGMTGATIDNSHVSDGYISIRKSIQIGAGEIAGQTIREVGIACGLGGLFVTHAMLQDMNGNQVSISVGALDVITIYATVYVRFDPTAGFTSIPAGAAAPGQFLSGIAGCGTSGWQTFVAQNIRAYIFNRVMNNGAQAGTPGLEKSGVISCNHDAKKILVRHSLAAGSQYRVGATEMNKSGGGGWRSIVYSGGLVIEFPHASKPYCTITDESVATGGGVETAFPLDFGFIINDGSFVLKLNGTPVSTDAYTVDWGVPANASNPAYWIVRISGTASSGMWGEGGSTGFAIYENPFYQIGVGVASMLVTRCRIEVSDDMDSWTQIYTTDFVNQNLSVPSEYVSKRYWKLTSTTGAGGVTTSASNIAFPMVRFNTPPAAGDAITASYRTASICKDSNHVVDLELELTLNEWTP